MSDLKEIKEFLKNYELKIKSLYKKSHLAHWNAQVTGKKEYYKEAELISKEIQKIHNNKEEFEKVKFFYKQKINDKIVERQVKLIYDSYLSCQGDLKLIHELTEKEMAVDRKFNTFRAEIENKKLTDNEIKEILRKETNSSKLQKAWEASKKQGQLVEKDLLEIVSLRNKLAKSLGFENYYLLSLELQEQTLKQLVKIFKELELATNNPFKKLKKEIDDYLSKKYNTNELKPWHYQDLFFQEAPQIYNLNLDKYFNTDILKIAENFYQSINLPVKDIIKRSSWYEAEGKCQHAFCMDIDREGDIRVLENIKNNEYWAETTLHELGHSVYCKFINHNLPYLLRSEAHILTTEAIAMLFGRLSHNVEFLRNHTDITKEEIKKISDSLNKMSTLKQLIMTRWILVMFNFEINLYKNPNQNLNKLWWTLVKKYQLINFTRNNPDWASKIHFTIAPVYYHNYMLGELYASQIHEIIAKKILNSNLLKHINYSNNPKIGEYLKKEIFSKGALLTWDKLIKESTGKELSTKSYIKQFAK